MTTTTEDPDMPDFTITVKTFTGAPDGPVCIDHDVLARALAANGALPRYAGDEYADALWSDGAVHAVASDKLHVTISAPGGAAAQAVAEALEADRFMYVDEGRGERGRWIYYTLISGAEPIGPGAGVLELLR